ncbi:hypothetical protein C7974DRAFT_447036 [Boeremia exigua]|uniref:uncharacterized protein n=1 Tax=Boeremia exigua TaxID=749465 RepID=UPI001E8DEB59|nr:uncharacterized protein C7974DRAFT_447036 [Boeremia exigua]KAH6642471.1 hypothetical protein C7974DRAFT_447036 [Boeremia exigua]
MTHLASGKDISTGPLNRKDEQNRLIALEHAASETEDASMEEGLPALPEGMQSMRPSPEPAIVPTHIQTDSPVLPPSPRHDEAIDDIPVWDPDEQHTVPATPSMRDDMDLDGDIPMQDRDDEPAVDRSNIVSQTEEIRAYQRHIKSLLLKVNAANVRPNASPTSAPAGSSARLSPEERQSRLARLIRSIPQCDQRRRFRDTDSRSGDRRELGIVEKEPGYDKKMLEDLFKGA